MTAITPNSIGWLTTNEQGNLMSFLWALQIGIRRFAAAVKKKEKILPGPGCNKVFAVVIVADAPLYAYAKYLSAAGKEQSKASKHTRQEFSRPAHTCTQLAVPPTHQPTPPAFSTFSGPHQTIWGSPNCNHALKNVNRLIFATLVLVMATFPSQKHHCLPKTPTVCPHLLLLHCVCNTHF